MSEETTNTQSGAGRADHEAWQEVGQQFKQLGESLAATFQAAWNNEEVRGQAQEMKTGLEALVTEVGRAIKETAASPEVKQAADDAVQAGEKAIHEARPHLLAALRTMNTELQTLIAKMEAPAPPPDSEGG